MAEAARKQRRTPLPSPRNLPIDTFVVLMMENRSFDHYLGWLPGADGRQAGLTYVDGAGQRAPDARGSRPTSRAATHPDPDHSWEGGRAQVNGGAMDGFLRSGDNDDFSIGYYAEEDLPFLGHAAKAFTTYDRFFCSLLASTYPNREYMHAAQSYGKIDNSLPEAGFQDQGFPDTTIFAALRQGAASTAATSSTTSRSPRCGAQPGLARSSRVDEYYQRAAPGRCRRCRSSTRRSLNEGGGTSGDEHPHGDIRAGQAFMSDVVHAFMESPQWKRGALFIVYDEWGGFFDHVRPPRVPGHPQRPRPRTRTSARWASGSRPWRSRRTCGAATSTHSIYGFESILKMIEYRFGLEPLTRRDAYAQNIARSFDFGVEAAPRAPRRCPTRRRSRGAVPEPAAGAEARAERRRSAPHEHDLKYLLTSGYLDRLGFKYRPATPATMYPPAAHGRLGARGAADAPPGRCLALACAAGVRRRGRGEGRQRHDASATSVRGTPRNDTLRGRGGNDRSTACAATTGSTAARARTGSPARPGNDRLFGRGGQRQAARRRGQRQPRRRRRRRRPQRRLGQRRAARPRRRRHESRRQRRRHADRRPGGDDMLSGGNGSDDAGGRRRQRQPDRRRPARTTLSGGDGNDTINARDGDRGHDRLRPGERHGDRRRRRGRRLRLRERDLPAAAGARRTVAPDRAAAAPPSGGAPRRRSSCGSC